MAEAEGNEEHRHFSLATKNSGVRCPLCLKEKRSFKNEICIDCDSWFLRNVDEFYHNPSRITCPKNPDGGCGKPTCCSCRLSNFMALTGFSMEDCPRNICYFCDQITICRLTNQVPQCSGCRKVFANRSKKGGVLAQECSCVGLSGKCPVCLVKKMIEVIGPRGTLGRKIQGMSKIKKGHPSSHPQYQEMSDLSENLLTTDSDDYSEDEELMQAPLRIVLNGIPPQCEEKAKNQLVSECCVVLRKFLPTNPAPRNLNEAGPSKRSRKAENLSTHRDRRPASTQFGVEFRNQVASSDLNPKPTFLNQLKKTYLNILDPLQLSPSSRSQTPNTDPVSSPIIPCNSDDESLGGLSLSNSPVLRSSSTDRNRRKRYSNSSIPPSTSYLPCTPLLDDLDLSRASASSSSIVEIAPSRTSSKEVPAKKKYTMPAVNGIKQTVEAGTQTEVDELKRENAELRAMIRNFKQSSLFNGSSKVDELERENADLKAKIRKLEQSLHLNARRSSSLDVIIPNNRSASPSTSITSTIISLCSPPRPPSQTSLMADLASPLPTEFVLPSMEPPMASHLYSAQEAAFSYEAAGLVLSSSSSDEDDVEVLDPRRLHLQPKVVIKRLTEADLLKYGVRMENRRHFAAVSQKPITSASKRLRSIFSDSSDSEADRFRSSSGAVLVRESPVLSSKKKRLDASQGDGDIRVDVPNVVSAEKRGDETRKGADKESKARGTDKKSKTRRDSESEKDKKKHHRHDDEKKKEKEKRKESEKHKDKQKDKEKEKKTPEKSKSSQSSSSKSKDAASNRTAAPQVTKFKIPRVRQISSPRSLSKAAAQSEPESILRADSHPGANVPSSNVPFSTPGTVGLPPMLYEHPLTTAPKAPVLPPTPEPVTVSPVSEAPVVAPPIEEMQVEEQPHQAVLSEFPTPAEKSSTTEGPKSLLRFFVPRTDQRKSVSFSAQLIDDKPQPPSYYDDLPDRNTPELPETTKSTSNRRWFTSERAREWDKNSTRRSGLFLSSCGSPNVSSQEDSSDAESTASKEDGEVSPTDEDTENPTGNTLVSSAFVSRDVLPTSPAKIPLNERSNNSPLNGLHPDTRSHPTKPASPLKSSTKHRGNSASQISSAEEFSSLRNAEDSMDVDEHVPRRADSEAFDACGSMSPDNQENSVSESKATSVADSAHRPSSSQKMEDEADRSSTPAQVSNVIVDGIVHEEENESEEEDILDLGLDDSEVFFCEEEDPPPPKEPVAKKVPAASATKENDNVVRREPSPLVANAVPAAVAPVKPRILPSGQDAAINSGLCFHYIGHGSCPYVAFQKCHYEHDAEPSKVLNYMKQLCKANNLDLTITLMTNIIKKESPLHAELAKDWGRSISSTVIWNLITYDPKDDPVRRKDFNLKRAEYAEAALRLLVSPEIRCTADMCVSTVKRLALTRPVSMSVAVFITRLYQRIDKENISVPTDVWYKILEILTEVEDWKKSIECLETALKYFPQFHPSPASVEFLFRDALTKKPELVTICRLFKEMDHGRINFLDTALKRAILSALENFGLQDLYGIFCQQIFTDVFPNQAPKNIAPVPRPGPSQPGLLQSGPSQLGHLQPGPSQPGLLQPGPSQLGLLQPGPSQLGLLQPGPSQPRAPIPSTSQPQLMHQKVQMPQPLPPQYRQPIPTAPPPRPPPPTPELLLRPPQPLIPGPPSSLLLPNEGNVNTKGALAARGPNVAVEPSYEAQEQLKRFYVEKNFPMMARLLINYSLNDVNHSLINDLLVLLKTLPDDSPGKFMASLAVSVVALNGQGNPLPTHVVDAILSLALSMLCHLQTSERFQDGYAICVMMEACDLPVFEYIKTKFVPPVALLFAAQCCLKSDDVRMCLRFLTSFHIVVKEISVEDELILLEDELSFEVTVRIQELQETIAPCEEGEVSDDQAAIWEITELLEDYQKEMAENSTRFSLIKSTHGGLM